MNENTAADATELLPALKADIDEFVGDAPQFDDITMLMMDYKTDMGAYKRDADPEGGASLGSRRFPAKTDALSDVISFVEETLEGFGCPMKLQTSLAVAIEEVFVNVAHYAYESGEGDVDISISFNSKTGDVTFRMRDKGIPFNPLLRPDPDVTLSLEEREIGGLGIFIAKKTMDSITYTYENEENVLTMIKKI